MNAYTVSITWKLPSDKRASTFQRTIMAENQACAIIDVLMKTSFYEGDVLPNVGEIVKVTATLV